jgi:hypothetical protein
MRNASAKTLWLFNNKVGVMFRNAEEGALF